MARRVSKHPTETELEILKVLWSADAPRSVRQVRDALSSTDIAGDAKRRRQPRAYTSVMTLLSIMHRKGYVRRRKTSSPNEGYLYTPAIGERDTGRGMLRDLVDRVFRGSTFAAMLNLLDTRELDERELRQLRAMVNRHKSSRKGKRP
jgi:predicted transcriptional regulator